MLFGKMEEINKLDLDTKEFIETNNVFIDVGDAPNTWIARKIPGTVSYGIPNTNPHIKKVKGKDTILNPNKTLYDCTYSFDDLGRRTTISSDSLIKDKVALFFGDAMAFGEGVNDNETLPSLFEKNNIEYRGYNYGFLGYGPSHMLLEISSDRFKQEFKGKKGKVFFVYRDDAIKVSVGKVPWLEGSPKYTYKEDKLTHSGEYSLADYDEEAIYLPSEFTNEDYKLTLKIFLECRRILREISPNLELNIITLPLSFTVQKMVKDLRDNGIICYNYYHVDLEYRTGKTARFLDGIHTPESNKVLIDKLTSDMRNGTFEDTLIPTGEIYSLDDLKAELRIHCFMLPCMVDFPVDDAGVIIAQLLKRYTGNESYSRTELLKDAEQWHNMKIFLVENQTLNLLYGKEYNRRY